MKRPAASERAGVAKKPAAAGVARKPAAAGTAKKPAAVQRDSAGFSLEEAPQFVELTTDAKARRLQLVAEGGPLVQLLVGDAIGDAFGLGIEMQDAFWIRRNVAFPPQEWPQSSLAPNGAPVTRRGMYSDDCEMTVGLMKALRTEGLALDSAGMLRAWKDEWELAGRQRIGHGTIRFHWAGQMTIEDVRRMQAEKKVPGNAPPMRSLPLLFLGEADQGRLCSANADSTHPHPRTRAASLVTAAAASWLVVSKGERVQIIAQSLAALQKSALRDGKTEDHLSALEALPDWHTYGPRFADMPKEVHALLCGPQPNPMLAGLKCGTPPGTIHGLGSDAMCTAGVVLYVLKWSRGPLDALAAAVDVGGDVDSTAALVLGMIGGSTGLALGAEGGIPAFLVWELEGVEYLVAQAHAFEAWLVEQGLWKR